MNFRSPALLELAKKAPHCMNPWCKAENNGQVVACHSNSRRHGKGMGIKAHDLCAYLCFDCHNRLDGRDQRWDAQERDRVFHEGVYHTVLWLLQEGHLEVVKKPRVRP